MSRRLLIGPSWRPTLARVEGDDSFFSVGSGTVSGKEPSNHSGTESPFELKAHSPAGLADNPDFLWLEVGFSIGGTYGITVQTVTINGCNGIPNAENGWPHYPQQWDFEEQNLSRFLVAKLITVNASGDNQNPEWKIKAVRMFGRNLVILSPIVQVCMVSIPYWAGSLEPSPRPRGDSTDKRGFFFCEADREDPLKPALFNPVGLLFN